jgi:predicted phage terminase large subunit-like protein
LCPERYDVKALERTRRKLGSYSFAALYQQDPVPAKGVKFKREWFKKIVDEAPKGLRWKRGYDLAVSLKTSADYTASFRCAYDKEGNLYIADGFRARIEYPDQRRYIVERMAAERDTEHGVEAALHGKALIQDLRRDRGNRAYAFKEIKVAADKLTRALAWLNLAEAGKLYLVRGAWIDEFVDEVAQFPHGKHDDQIDAVSIAVSMLAKKEFLARGYLIP